MQTVKVRKTLPGGWGLDRSGPEPIYNPAAINKCGTGLGWRRSCASVHIQTQHSLSGGHPRVCLFQVPAPSSKYSTTAMGGESRYSDADESDPGRATDPPAVTFSTLWARLFTRKETKVLILGLDNAGKVGRAGRLLWSRMVLGTHPGRLLTSVALTRLAITSQPARSPSHDMNNWMPLWSSLVLSARPSAFTPRRYCGLCAT